MENNEAAGSRDKKIIKEIVLGFAVIKCKSLPPLAVGENPFYLRVEPITASWERDIDEVNIGEDEEVVGILPAPQGSFAVLKVMPDGSSYERLGYEYPGAYHPDWFTLKV